MMLFLCSVFSSFTQDIESQLPIGTKFSNGLIIFTLPSAYHTAQFRPLAVPRFVTTRRTMQLSAGTPDHDALIALLTARLSKPPKDNDRAETVNYLKDIALFIYLSNNNTTKLPLLARNLLSKWEEKNISFREELKLVKEYLRLADLNHPQ